MDISFDTEDSSLEEFDIIDSLSSPEFSDDGREQKLLESLQTVVSESTNLSEPENVMDSSKGYNSSTLTPHIVTLKKDSFIELDIFESISNFASSSEVNDNSVAGSTKSMSKDTSDNLDAEGLQLIEALDHCALQFKNALEGKESKQEIIPQCNNFERLTLGLPDVKKAEVKQAETTLAATALIDKPGYDNFESDTEEVKSNEKQVEFNDALASSEKVCEKDVPTLELDEVQIKTSDKTEMSEKRIGNFKAIQSDHLENTQILEDKVIDIENKNYSNESFLEELLLQVSDECQSDDHIMQSDSSENSMEKNNELYGCSENDPKEQMVIYNENSQKAVIKQMFNLENGDIKNSEQRQNQIDDQTESEEKHTNSFKSSKNSVEGINPLNLDESSMLGFADGNLVASLHDFETKQKSNVVKKESDQPFAVRHCKIVLKKLEPDVYKNYLLDSNLFKGSTFGNAVINEDKNEVTKSEEDTLLKELPKNIRKRLKKTVSTRERKKHLHKEYELSPKLSSSPVTPSKMSVNKLIVVESDESHTLKSSTYKYTNMHKDSDGSFEPNNLMESDEEKTKESEEKEIITQMADLEKNSAKRQIKQDTHIEESQKELTQSENCSVTNDNIFIKGEKKVLMNSTSYSVIEESDLVENLENETEVNESDESWCKELTEHKMVSVKSRSIEHSTKMHIHTETEMKESPSNGNSTEDFNSPKSSIESNNILEVDIEEMLQSNLSKHITTNNIEVNETSESEVNEHMAKPKENRSEKVREKKMLKTLGDNQMGNATKEQREMDIQMKENTKHCMIAVDSELSRKYIKHINVLETNEDLNSKKESLSADGFVDSYLPDVVKELTNPLLECQVVLKRLDPDTLKAHLLYLNSSYKGSQSGPCQLSEADDDSYENKSSKDIPTEKLSKKRSSTGRKIQSTKCIKRQKNQISRLMKKKEIQDKKVHKTCIVLPGRIKIKEISCDNSESCKDIQLIKSKVESIKKCVVKKKGQKKSVDTRETNLETNRIEQYTNNVTKMPEMQKEMKTKTQPMRNSQMSEENIKTLKINESHMVPEDESSFTNQKLVNLLKNTEKRKNLEDFNFSFKIKPCRVVLERLDLSACNSGRYISSNMKHIEKVAPSVTKVKKQKDTSNKGLKKVKKDSEVHRVKKQHLNISKSKSNNTSTYKSSIHKDSSLKSTKKKSLAKKLIPLFPIKECSVLLRRCSSPCLNTLNEDLCTPIIQGFQLDSPKIGSSNIESSNIPVPEHGSITSSGSALAGGSNNSGVWNSNNSEACSIDNDASDLIESNVSSPMYSDSSCFNDLSDSGDSDESFKDSVKSKISNTPHAIRRSKDSTSRELSDKKYLKNLSCALCEKTFKTHNSLLTHQTKIHGRNPFKCGLCKTTFVLHGSFFSHMRNFHPEMKPYVCDYRKCEESFSTKKNLSDHLMCHQNFVCRFCKKRFTKKIHMYHHIDKYHKIH